MNTCISFTEQMNLRDAILTVLSENVWMTTDDVIAKVLAMDWMEVDPRKSEIISTLEALAKERRIIHLLEHSVSIWRRRSEKEFAELQAEKSGKQGRLL